VPPLLQDLLLLELSLRQLPVPNPMFAPTFSNELGFRMTRSQLKLP
jgi:hypothetical protein